jgi:hypothetical protein
MNESLDEAVIEGAAAITPDEAFDDGVASRPEPRAPAKPIHDGAALLESILAEASIVVNPEETPEEAAAAGERLVIKADREIVLQCGSASITLTRSGKIVIRGEYVVTRAAGVNRILGGSVQIN